MTSRCLTLPNDRTEAEGRAAGGFPAIKFEPHAGYGSKIGGDPFPFGYLSTSPTPQPIFELTVLLGFEVPKLHATAHKIALAYNSYDAMRAALEEAANWSAGEPTRTEKCKSKTLDQVRALMDSALALARGEKP